LGALFEKPPDQAAFFIVGFSPRQDVLTAVESKG